MFAAFALQPFDYPRMAPGFEKASSGLSRLLPSSGTRHGLYWRRSQCSPSVQVGNIICSAIHSWMAGVGNFLRTSTDLCRIIVQRVD